MFEKFSACSLIKMPVIYIARVHTWLRPLHLDANITIKERLLIFSVCLSHINRNNRKSGNGCFSRKARVSAYMSISM